MTVKKKYYFLYITTNLVNGKYYKGLHATDDLFDGYLGSGRAFQLALRKYGRQAFKRQIVLFCPDAKSLYHAESLYITKEDINSDMCYNLTVGGGGVTSDHAYHGEVSPETRELQSISRSAVARRKKKSHKLFRGRITKDKTGALKIRGTHVKAGTRQVFCAELNERYVSATQAAEIHGLEKTNIFATCVGRHNRCGGYHWFFPDLYTADQLKELHIKYRVTAIVDVGLGCYAGRAIPVHCVELNRDFPSLTNASQFVNRTPTQISKAVKRNGKCGGYHWIVIPDYERMTSAQLNPEETSCSSPSAESSD